MCVRICFNGGYNAIPRGIKRKQCRPSKELLFVYAKTNRLFCYIDSTNPLLPKSKMCNFQPYSMVKQRFLCLTWSKIPKTGFLLTRLKSDKCYPLNSSSSLSTLFSSARPVRITEHPHEASRRAIPRPIP